MPTHDKVTQVITGWHRCSVVVALRTLRVSRLVKQLPAVVIIINSLSEAHSFRVDSFKVDLVLWSEALRLISIVFVILAFMVYIGAIVFRVLLNGTDVGRRLCSSREA